MRKTPKIQKFQNIRKFENFSRKVPSYLSLEPNSDHLSCPCLKTLCFVSRFVPNLSVVDLLARRSYRQSFQENTEMGMQEMHF